MLRRLYALLLVLYPQGMRQRFSRDMMDCFDDMVRHAVGRGRMIAAWRVILELPRSALKARLNEYRQSRHRSFPSRRGSGMETVLHDVRYAVRGLVRQPGLTSLAVLSLALGIGANTGMISSVNALIWSDLPVPEADRLIRLYEYEGRFANVSYANYRDIRDGVSSIGAVSVHTLNAFSVYQGGSSEIVYGELVSANYFDMLQVPAIEGRTFGAREGEAREPVVVLGSAFWHRAFGGSPDVIGQAIRVNGHTMTIVGVAAEEFNGTKYGLGMDMWVPVESWGQLEGWTDWIERRGSRWLEVVGRLAPGATQEGAQQELDALAGQLATAYPRTNTNRTFRVTEEGIPVPDAEGLPQLIGMVAIAASSMVLLVACANVASLLLARGVTRRREIGIRRALGAAPARIARQLFTESLLLAGVGGTLGVAFAYWTSGFLWWFIPALPYRFAIDTSPDGGVLLIAAAVTLLTAFVFGLVPALQAARTDVVSAVRAEGGAGAADGTTGRRLRFVVTTMMALAFVTLLLTGLFARSLAHVRSLDPGFAATGRLLATMDASLAGYDADRALTYFEAVERRVRAIPGVNDAAMAETVPLGDRSSSSEVFAGDRSYAENDHGIQAISNGVSPQYFAAMDIRLLRGRTFGPSDRGDGPPVIIINQALADRLWPNEDAIGRRVRFSPTSEDGMEIVGVVADGRYLTISEAQRAAYYRPMTQARSRSMELIIQTAAAPTELAPLVREATRGVDPLVPIFNMRTISEHLSGALWMFRLGAGLGAALGGLALALATAGLYGVMIFAVNQRRHELGLRIALGAQRTQVVTLVLRQAAWMVGLGILVGGTIALALAGPLQAALVGVQPRDPLAFGGVIGILLLVTLVACLVPARGAVRADPITSLRADA